MTSMDVITDFKGTDGDVIALELIEFLPREAYFEMSARSFGRAAKLARETLETRNSDDAEAVLVAQVGKDAFVFANTLDDDGAAYNLVIKLVGVGLDMIGASDFIAVEQLA